MFIDTQKQLVPCKRIVVFLILILHTTLHAILHATLHVSFKK
jgi:hypothetical protein